jgi:hypothetical protein
MLDNMFHQAHQAIQTSSKPTQSQFQREYEERMPIVRVAHEPLLIENFHSREKANIAMNNRPRQN